MRECYNYHIECSVYRPLIQGLTQFTINVLNIDPVTKRGLKIDRTYLTQLP